MLALSLAAGCDVSDTARPSAPQVSLETIKRLDIGRCAPGPGFTVVSTNPWFPLDVGRQLVLEGEEEGETLTNRVTVLNVTRTIEGVVTRVVEEREFVDGVLSEVTWNYHVQAPDGSICYYGEDVDVYTDAGITHEGAWCPGGDNHPGIFMPADPQPGMEYQNEVAPGIALDEARIVGAGPTTVPFGRFDETIRIREFDPLTGSKDHKIHARGVGIIVDGTQELVDINFTSGAPESPSISVQQCGS
jgi:hypothetical protein